MPRSNPDVPPRGLPPKAAVYEALCDALAGQLAALVAAAKDAAEGATHEEGRAEGDKDMRATEQSYLARGQALRAVELGEALARTRANKPGAFGEGDPVACGALVQVELEGEPRVVFLARDGGGTVLEVHEVQITIVTPSSPLGRALLGKRVGDPFELLVRDEVREGSLLAVG